jgi:hypothetical protein
VASNRAAYNRAWHKAHPDRIDGNRALVLAAKSGPCMDCGGVFHYSVMDLDHVRGEKRFALALAGHYSKAVVEAEIAKCDLVCSNCHRMRTFKRRGGP